MPIRLSIIDKVTSLVITLPTLRSMVSRKNTEYLWFRKQKKTRDVLFQGCQCATSATTVTTSTGKQCATRHVPKQGSIWWFVR